MTYQIIQQGESRSFPQGDAFVEAATDSGNGVFLIGTEVAQAWPKAAEQTGDKAFVAIELDTECLGVYTGEDTGPSNVVGFARFRLGDDAPTRLVELVKKPFTDPAAIAAVRQVLEGGGLVVVVCNDFTGRILNRLLRPYYNAVLRRLDEGLATASDMDQTLCMGLGYPEGPLTLLNRTGLHHHYRVTQQLYEALGEAPYAPARRAQVAWARHQQEQQ